MSCTGDSVSSLHGLNYASSVPDTQFDDGFSLWLLKSAVKRGYVNGATDDFGHTAAVDPMHPIDCHLTLSDGQSSSEVTALLA